MNFQDIKDLIKLIDETELAEFKLKDGDLELSIRTKYYGATKQPVVQSVATPPQAMVPVPPAQQEATPPPAAAPAKSEPEAEKPQEAKSDESQYLEIKSPIVGTFYRASSPDKPPYVKIGESIEKGAVVCIVEAMKLFNEIESEISGTIVKVVVEDAQPVEYDQVLFLVDPS